MTDTYGSDVPTSFVAMNMKKLVFIIICGAIAGLVTWGLSILLDTYIYKAILCNGDAAVQCASSYQYAITTATIIGAAVGLFGLVRLHVFRPLLIVIAAFIALWGLLALIRPFAWYTEMITVVGLYAFAFGLFGWLARIKLFYIALIAVIIIAVVTRLLLNS